MTNTTAPRSADIILVIDGYKAIAPRSTYENILRHVADEGMTEEALDAISRLHVIDWETGEEWSDLIALEDFIASEAEVLV